MRAGQALAEVLRREGVEIAFCFPSNPLIDDLAEAGIRPIVGREERGVINMADAYSRTSNGRKIGVCLVQHGPGSEHSFGGIAQAYADSVPLLYLPAGMARAKLGLRTTFDSVTAYRPVTKWAARFDTAATVPHHLRRAFHKMRNGRPGPVLLEMPADVVDEELPDDQFDYAPPIRLRSGADLAAVRQAVDMLSSAERPLIHVGQGVLWAGATDELVRFAELVDVPVMTTYTAKSAFPEDHPLALGCGGVALSDGIDALLNDADVIFSIGASMARTLGSFPLPPGKTIVQITNDPDDIGMEYPVACGLVGDAQLVLEQLVGSAVANVKRARGSAAVVAGIRDAARERWRERFESDATPVSPYRLVAEMIAAFDPAETVITHDSGYPRDHLAPHYVATTPRGYLGWGNSTPLGSSIPLAIGAKAAARDKVAVAYFGDAAFGQSGLEVETSVRNGLPVLFVLANNSQMGNYEKLQPIAQEKFGLKFLTGNYADIAAALGAYAIRVDKPEDIAPALQEGLASVRGGRSCLIEVITDADATIVRALRP